MRGGALEVGDRNLVKVVSFEGKHKIADRWEDIPYIIFEQPNTDITYIEIYFSQLEPSYHHLYRLRHHEGSRIQSSRQFHPQRMKTLKMSLFLYWYRYQDSLGPGKDHQWRTWWWCPRYRVGNRRQLSWDRPRRILSQWYKWLRTTSLIPLIQTLISLLLQPTLHQHNLEHQTEEGWNRIGHRHWLNISMITMTE
jgi:hypothetical protein